MDLLPDVLQPAFGSMPAQLSATSKAKEGEADESEAEMSGEGAGCVELIEEGHAVEFRKKKRQRTPASGSDAGGCTWTPARQHTWSADQSERWAEETLTLGMFDRTQHVRMCMPPRRGPRDGFQIERWDTPVQILRGT